MSTGFIPGGASETRNVSPEAQKYTASGLTSCSWWALGEVPGMGKYQRRKSNHSHLLTSKQVRFVASPSLRCERIIKAPTFSNSGQDRPLALRDACPLICGMASYSETSRPHNTVAI